MTTRHPMDPDDPERSQSIRDEIAEDLIPIEPAADERLAVRERLMARVREARDRVRSVTFVRPHEDGFRDLMRGVRVMELSATNQAVLLEFAPGASLPVHRHREDEECVVIRGSARIHETQVREGDYHLAHARSRHAVVRSEHGALLYVRGTPIGSFAGVLRDLAAAWLPTRAADHLTLRADDDEWAQMCPGVAGRVLYERDGYRSMMLRLAAGARLQSMRVGCPTESIVVAGEAYFGDERADRGDYAVFARGDDLPEVSSDSGATVFLRLTNPLPALVTTSDH